MKLVPLGDRVVLTADCRGNHKVRYRSAGTE